MFHCKKKTQSAKLGYCSIIKTNIYGMWWEILLEDMALLTYKAAMQSWASTKAWQNSQSWASTTEFC